MKKQIYFFNGDLHTMGAPDSAATRPDTSIPGSKTNRADLDRIAARVKIFAFWESYIFRIRLFLFGGEEILELNANSEDGGIRRDIGRAPAAMGIALDGIA